MEAAVLFFKVPQILRAPTTLILSLPPDIPAGLLSAGLLSAGLLSAGLLSVWNLQIIIIPLYSP